MVLKQTEKWKRATSALLRGGQERLEELEADLEAFLASDDGVAGMKLLAVSGKSIDLVWRKDRVGQYDAAEFVLNGSGIKRMRYLSPAISRTEFPESSTAFALLTFILQHQDDRAYLDMANISWHLAREFDKIAEEVAKKNPVSPDSRRQSWDHNGTTL